MAAPKGPEVVCLWKEPPVCPPSNQEVVPPNQRLCVDSGTEVSQVLETIRFGPRSSKDQEQPEATHKRRGCANCNKMIIKGAPVNALRSQEGTRVSAGEDVGSFLVDRSTKGTIWGGVVPMCVKLAAHTGTTGEELPPPMAFCWRKTSGSLSKRLPSHIIKLKWSKQEVVVVAPVCLDFWFPNLGVEGLKRKTQLLDTIDTEPPRLVQ